MPTTAQTRLWDARNGAAGTGCPGEGGIAPRVCLVQLDLVRVLDLSTALVLQLILWGTAIVMGRWVQRSNPMFPAHSPRETDEFADSGIDGMPFSGKRDAEGISRARSSG